jgi:hypothetical protein
LGGPLAELVWLIQVNEMASSVVAYYTIITARSVTLVEIHLYIHLRYIEVEKGIH